jgi:hypothetical protein
MERRYGMLAVFLISAVAWAPIPCREHFERFGDGYFQKVQSNEALNAWVELETFFRERDALGSVAGFRVEWTEAETKEFLKHFADRWRRLQREKPEAIAALAADVLAKEKVITAARAAHRKNPNPQEEDRIELAVFGQANLLCEPDILELLPHSLQNDLSALLARQTRERLKSMKIPFVEVKRQVSDLDRKVR